MNSEEKWLQYQDEAERKIENLESQLKEANESKDILEKKLAECEQRIQEAEEVVRFYAKEGNWDDRILLILDDTEDTAWSSYNGGKRARAYLASRSGEACGSPFAKHEAKQGKE